MFMLNEFCLVLDFDYAQSAVFFFQKEAPNLIGSFCIFCSFAVVVARNDPTNCPLLIVNYQLSIRLSYRRQRSRLHR